MLRHFNEAATELSPQKVATVGSVIRILRLLSVHLGNEGSSVDDDDDAPPIQQVHPAVMDFKERVVVYLQNRWDGCYRAECQWNCSPKFSKWTRWRFWQVVEARRIEGVLQGQLGGEETITTQGKQNKVTMAPAFFIIFNPSFKVIQVKY